MHESKVMTRREVLVGAAATALIATVPSSAIAAVKKSRRSGAQIQSMKAPLKRYMAASALLPDGRVLITGGYAQTWSNSAEPKALNSVVIFDPAKNQLFAAASMIVPRARHAAVTLQDGRVAVIGGIGRNPTASVEIYDPRTNTWHVASPLSQPRFDHSAVSNGDSVFVIGGSSSSSVSSIEVFHPESTSANALNP